MSFLALAELFAAYIVIGFIFVFGALMAWIELHGLPPLLDGTRLGSALDDRDRAHMLDHALAEDREVAWLDSVWDLPSRDPQS